MSTPSFFLCVDCGGTKTSAVICDSTGKITGRALGGPSNYSYLGLQPFIQVLQATVEKALFSTTLPSVLVNPLSISGFASVWIGVSGVDSPNDIRTLTMALSPIFAIPPGNRLQVTNDANLLASPLRVHAELESAVTVIAGTGSIVVSFKRSDEQDSDGPVPLMEMARAGGWGWILGDVGSGFDVGREVLREMLARADRALVHGSTGVVSNQSLQSCILSHFGVTTVPDLFNVIYAPDPPPTPALCTTTSQSDTTNISRDQLSPSPHPTCLLPRERRLSQLTPLVFQAAFEKESGDELALTVLTRCAGSLADSIASVLTSTSSTSRALQNGVEASRSVLCLGGSLVGVTAYRNLVLEKLKNLGHVFPVVEFVGGGDVAAAGAEGMSISLAR